MITNHQKEVMDVILPEIKVGCKLLLKGSAGVGKTYLLDQLISYYKARNYMYGPVYVTAPTHKALSVLRDKVTKRPYQEFKTIHSLLNMKRKIKSNGTIEFVQDERMPCDLSKASLLIVDEASMLPDNILKILMNYDAPMVFVGDDKQLNPINEDDSPAFISKFKSFELTEIIRQGVGNPIIDLSRNISTIWDKKGCVVHDDENAYGYAYTNDRNKIVSRLAEVNGTDEIKYLSWTNIDVDKMNSDVRKLLYGDKPKKVEVGESIVFKNPFDDYHTNDELKIETSEEMVIDMAVPTGRVIGNRLEFNEQKIKIYMVNNTVPIVHEDSVKGFHVAVGLVKKLAVSKKIDWKTYYDFYEQYAQFTYNHAITVHKSQGSTYKKAIINVKNLNLNKREKEKQRLFYTAITRASNLVVLYNV